MAEGRTSRFAALRTATLAVLFSVTCAITLFAAGFAMCTLQPTTQVFSRLFSDFEHSAYSPADTTALAVATRDFTVVPYRDGQAAACEKLAQEVVGAAQRAGIEQTDAPANADAVQRMYQLAEKNSSLALGEDEIGHLIDCNRLINTAVPILIVIAVIALGCGVALGATGNARSAGRALVAAPALLVVCMVALGIWALVDFNGFFTAFHGLFFPQGNWMFPADSLLICMLPTPFWVGMAALWAITTIVGGIICIAIGMKLARR